MGIRQRLLDPRLLDPRLLDPRLPDPQLLAAGVADENDRLRLLVASMGEYAIFLLAPDGTVMSWNPGAEQLKGYRGHEIVGRHFGVFYPPEDSTAGQPERQLAVAVRDGVSIDSGWRVRQDGTRFWAHAVITALYDGPVLRGFAKVTRDDTAARAAFESGRAIEGVTRALLAGVAVGDGGIVKTCGLVCHAA